MGHIRYFGTATTAALALSLVACDVSPKSATSDDKAAAASEATVTRERVMPQEEAPVARMPAQAAIQSQPGSDGAQVDLLKASVTGDILTITLRCSSEEKINSETIDVRKISVIDDATSQRISVLKDNAGNWMASNVTGNSIGTQCEVKPGIFWAKFPAPPATSQTISISLPDVAPFDGVPVTR